MKQVSYEQQTIESPNPIARFAYKSRIKKSIEYTSIILPDFGSGEGLNTIKMLQKRDFKVLTLQRKYDLIVSHFLALLFYYKC